MEEIRWLGRNDELEFSRITVPTKLVGRLWKYEQAIDKLIAIRVVIFGMSLFVFYPMFTNYFFYDVFDVNLLVTLSLCSVFLIISGLLYNRNRVLAIFLALIPIGFMLFNLLVLQVEFFTKTICFYGAVFITLFVGFWIDFKAQKLRKEILDELKLDALKEESA